MWRQIGKERIFSNRAPEEEVKRIGSGAAWDCSHSLSHIHPSPISPEGSKESGQLVW